MCVCVHRISGYSVMGTDQTDQVKGRNLEPVALRGPAGAQWPATGPVCNTAHPRSVSCQTGLESCMQMSLLFIKSVLKGLCVRGRASLSKSRICFPRGVRADILSTFVYFRYYLT